MTETKTRSFIKAISWRITGTLDTFIISWLITGKVQLASSIAVIEVTTKILYYWIHERVWAKIKWGQHE